MEELKPISNSKWYKISPYNLSQLKRGDYIKVIFHPYSQKHFYKPDFEFFFPIYFGKLMSSHHNRPEDMLIKNQNGKSFYFEDRAGTSAMADISFYRPSDSKDVPKEPKNHPYFDL